MIHGVISGGQTGADLAGWHAAKAAGIGTGGWMPKGFRTEEGPRPEYATIYGAKEDDSPAYPPRTRKNVQDSHGTLMFALDPYSSGSYITTSACENFGKSFLVIRPGSKARHPSDVAEWLNRVLISHWEKVIINIAGNRESKCPGINAWTSSYLTEVFRILKIQEA